MAIEESKQEEYSIDDIIRLMKEEEFGLHISLLNSGETSNGKILMNIVVESDMNKDMIIDILKGLLQQYEGVGD